MIRIERRFRNEPNGQGGVLVVDKQPGEKDQSISGAGGGIRINVPKSKPHGLSPPNGPSGPIFL